MDVLPQTDCAPQPAPSRARRFAKTRRWLKRGLIAFFALIFFTGSLLLTGLIPVNRDFVEPDQGIEIFVYSGPFHSDLILPIKTELVDWRTKFDSQQFKTDTSWATHMAFGWGDKDFYINTPTWSDLSWSTACWAFCVPTKTVMHVSHQQSPAESPEVRSVRISAAQYQNLVDFIVASFEPGDAGEVQLIPDEAYGSFDAFFQGSGKYHCFRTCNCWVGEGLKTAEVKTGWFTPLPKTVFLYFPE